MLGKGGWGVVFCSVLPVLCARADMTYFAYKGQVNTVVMVGISARAHNTGRTEQKTTPHPPLPSITPPLQ